MIKNKREYLHFLEQDRLALKVRRLWRKLGFSIPANVFGPSLSKKGTAPHIGDDCYLGPGAKIYGDIKIGNNVAIGANAVVNKSLDSNCTIAGIPAKVIADKGPLEILKNKRTEINY